MLNPIPTLNDLFAQLGLPSGDQDIEAFITRHKPIPSNVLLHEAEFWSDAQGAFLHQAITDDADWAEVVDHLDVRLRE